MRANRPVFASQKFVGSFTISGDQKVLQTDVAAFGIGRASLSWSGSTPWSVSSPGLASRSRIRPQMTVDSRMDAEVIEAGPKVPDAFRQLLGLVDDDLVHISVKGGRWCQGATAVSNGAASRLARASAPHPPRLRLHVPHPNDHAAAGRARRASMANGRRRGRRSGLLWRLSPHSGRWLGSSGPASVEPRRLAARPWRSPRFALDQSRESQQDNDSLCPDPVHAPEPRKRVVDRTPSRR